MADLSTLIRIGYWAAERNDQWPGVADFIDPSWDESVRERVLKHLRQGLPGRAYLGRSVCRICGAPNGSLELSDGTYIWPEGLAHYVAVHDVRLPTQFVDHVGRVRQMIEDAEVDDRWWRNATPDWASPCTRSVETTESGDE